MDIDIEGTVADNPIDTEDKAAETLKQALLATKNNDDPYDLSTPYGQYTSIQAVLQGYSNQFHLQRLVNKPHEDLAQAAQALQEVNVKWALEVLTLAEKKSKFELRSTPRDQ